MSSEDKHFIDYVTRWRKGMKAYEYKVETTLLNDRPDVGRITELSKEGWELVSVAGGQMMSSYCAQVATSFFYRKEK